MIRSRRKAISDTKPYGFIRVRQNGPAAMRTRCDFRYTSLSERMAIRRGHWAKLLPYNSKMPERPTDNNAIRRESRHKCLTQWFHRIPTRHTCNYNEIIDLLLFVAGERASFAPRRRTDWINRKTRARWKKKLYSKSIGKALNIIK